MKHRGRIINCYFMLTYRLKRSYHIIWVNTKLVFEYKNILLGKVKLYESLDMRLI